MEVKAYRNPVKFNKDMCKILYVERKSPLHQYRLGTDCLASSSAKNGLEILVNSSPM